MAVGRVGLFYSLPRADDAPLERRSPISHADGGVVSGIKPFDRR